MRLDRRVVTARKLMWKCRAVLYQHNDQRTSRCAIIYRSRHTIVEPVQTTAGITTRLVQLIECFYCCFRATSQKSAERSLLPSAKTTPALLNWPSLPRWRRQQQQALFPHQMDFIEITGRMTGNRSMTDEEEEGPVGPQHEQVPVRMLSSRTSSQSGDENSVSTTMTATNNTIKDIPKKPPPTAGSASSVQVAVRVRPLLSSLESGCGTCMHVIPPSSLSSNVSTTIHIGGEAGPNFTFDEVFPTNATQVQVYEHRVVPLVESCLQGYNASILAYGQTGSGYVQSITDSLIRNEWELFVFCLSCW